MKLFCFPGWFWALGWHCRVCFFLLRLLIGRPRSEAESKPTSSFLSCETSNRHGVDFASNQAKNFSLPCFKRAQSVWPKELAFFFQFGGSPYTFAFLSKQFMLQASLNFQWSTVHAVTIYQTMDSYLKKHFGALFVLLF
jgi:hypothetical protein